MHADEQQQQVTGQVMYRRRLSSKLVFYDVLVQAGAAAQWWEVVVKVGIYGSVQDVKDLRDSLKLGDHVEVTGWCEGQQQHPELQAVSIKVTQSWKLHSTGVSFKPQPAPRAQHKQRAAPPSLPQQQKQQPAAHGVDGKSHAHSASAERQVPADTLVKNNANFDTVAAAAVAGAVDAVDAARVTAPQVAICKFWVNTGRCAKGGNCPFLHTLLPAAAGGALSRRRWLQQREVERQQRSAEAGFMHNSSAAAKRRRASVFAAWLVQQYGKQQLNSGAGVLDVAGGSGSLTFELAYEHGIKCTLIDPRKLKLNKLQHKQLQQAGSSVAISTLTMQQLQEGDVAATCIVQHYQQPQQQQELCRVTSGQTSTQQQDDCVQHRSHAVDVQLSLASLVQQQDADEQQQQQHQAGAMPPMEGHSLDMQQQGCDSPPEALHLRQVQAWFGPELWDAPGWQQLYGDCSIIVGLHPDQATEPILQMAVQQQLPFAIMPCCVFPRLFPQRRLQQADGESVPVVSYEQLVGYLVQHGGAQQTVLDFAGANIVVYRL